MDILIIIALVILFPIMCNTKNTAIKSLLITLYLLALITNPMPSICGTVISLMWTYI